MPRPVLVRLAAAAMLAGALPLAAAPAALACMVAPVQKGVIDQAAERVLFIKDGDSVTAHVQVQYYGDPEAFGWVVPVAAEPTVGVGSDALFRALREATRPTFDLTYRTTGTCKTREAASSGAAKRAPSRAAAPAAGAAAPAADVTVVSQRNVGPYASTVLRADSAGGLRAWLTENGYAIPAKLDDAMGDYVAGGYYFAALKLQKDRTAGDLRPITLTYRGDETGLPIRLASLSAVPDMDLFVWVLGDHRAVPANYDHVEINEARIDWFNEGRNYRQVVTEAMNDIGGKAFVTDFAGASAGVAIDPGVQRQATLSSEPMKALTTAGALIDYVLAHPEDFAEDPTTFLSHQIPGYDGGTAGGADRAAPVDAAKAAEAWETGTIAPARAVVQAFEAHAYLTQLYTTMSPDEMVVDPVFVFNPDMDRVDRDHHAEAITECGPQYYEEDAPVRIKLADGGSFYAKAGTIEEGTTRPKAGTGKTQKVPAVRNARRCGTTGGGTVVKDNGNAIFKLLSDFAKDGVVLSINTAVPGSVRDGAGGSIVVTFPFAQAVAKAVTGGGGVGFGCAGCASPATTPVAAGANEGGAYALLAAGFLGYRGWLGRRRKARARK